MARFAPDIYFAADLIDFLRGTRGFRPKVFDSEKKFADYIRWNLLLIVMGADIPHGPKPGRELSI